MRSAVLAIAAKDLRQRIRDRSALVLGFVAPVLVAALMNLAFSGAEQFHASVVVVDADASELSRGMAEGLAAPDLADVLTVETAPDEAAARHAVDAGDADAAIVIPAGFGASVSGGATADLVVLSSVDAELAGEVVRSIATSFTSRVAAARLSVAAALAGGAAVADAPALATAALEARPPLAVVERPTGDRPLEGVAYYGPAMAIFFVLFAIGFTAQGWFRERANGTLLRMAAAPIRTTGVLAGKSLSVFVYALASLLTMSFATALLFGASWGNPVGVVVLCTAMATTVVALAAFVMTVARTERQAETVASAVTFGLALLGGTFVFLGSAPDVMRRLAVLTPNGWALRGFTDLATGVGVAEAVTMPVIGMLVFAAVVAGLAALLGRGAVLR